MLKDIFSPATRKTMNIAYSATVAALGIWAAVVAAIPGATLPEFYQGIVVGVLAVGGYLGLQSAANVTDTPDNVKDIMVGGNKFNDDKGGE